MRAAVVDHYGPPEVVRITELPDPVPPAGQVVVDVRAAAVTRGDARLRSGVFPRGFGLPGKLALGLRGPRHSVLGGVFAGLVTATGPEVTDVRVGDRVAGMNGIRMGSHAELMAVPVSSLTGVPDRVSNVDAAAALFGGSTALYLLREKSTLESARTVLINGASGSVGSAALQIAVHAGAEVTAVTSGPNTDLVRRLGATHVIDYTQDPISDLYQGFDIVVDAVGNLSRKDADRLCNPAGELILVAAGLTDTVLARGQVVSGTVKERSEDFATVLNLVASGSLDPLAHVVGGLDDLTEAYRQLDTGHKVGNLVIEP